MEYLTYKNRAFKHLLSAPFIYSVFFAFIILDIFVEIYHRICFPLYGIEYVDRKKYIKLDRQKLPYLNIFQKINCMYCGYGNGLAQYVTEIAAQTEIYWCGIQHEKDPNFQSPNHHKDFLKYGDEAAYMKKYNQDNSEKECKLIG